MQRVQEKVWCTVTPDVLAEIEAIRADIEEKTRIKPSVSRVVLMLITRGLEASKR